MRSVLKIDVAHVSRKRSSASGNPTKAMHATDGEVFVTAPDAMCAYALSDNARGEYIIVLNSRGRVVNVEQVTP